MTDLSSRFVEAVTILGLKNADIAKKYNVSRQNVNNFFTNQKTLTQKFAEICDGENINLNWLLTGKGNKFINDTNQMVITKTSDLIEIPYFKNTYAAAGNGALNYDETPAVMAFNQDFLKSQLGITSFKNLHIINTVGDSMEPTITEGSLLFINPFENESHQIKDGGIYVINTQSGVLVKRINHDPFGGKVLLRSDNIDVPDISIKEQELENCIIMGRVVGHFNSL